MIPIGVRYCGRRRQWSPGIFHTLREDQGQEEQEDKLSGGGRVEHQKKRRAWRRGRDLGRGEGSGGGWGLGRLGRKPVGGSVMARLLRALRGLPLLQAPGRLARGCAGSGSKDTGRSSIAAVSRGFRFHSPG